LNSSAPNRFGRNSQIVNQSGHEQQNKGAGVEDTLCWSAFNHYGSKIDNNEGFDMICLID